jgi:hypothetical protein
MLSEGITAKLGDVGLARVFDEAAALAGVSAVGSPYYTAPEVHTHRYDAKVDVFSFGLMFSEIVLNDLDTGRPMAADLASLLRSCCQRDPRDRKDSASSLRVLEARLRAEAEAPACSTVPEEGLERRTQAAAAAAAAAEAEAAEAAARALVVHAEMEAKLEAAASQAEADARQAGVERSRQEAQEQRLRLQQEADDARARQDAVARSGEKAERRRQVWLVLLLCVSESTRAITVRVTGICVTVLAL